MGTFQHTPSSFVPEGAVEIMRDEKNAASSTTTPVQTGTAAEANLAIDTSPSIVDSDLEKEADYTIDPADI